MITNYKEFLLERNNIRKIQKFVNIPDIYNWAHEKDENLSVWLADQMVKMIESKIYKDITVHKNVIKKMFELYLKDELTLNNIKPIYIEYQQPEKEVSEEDINKHINISIADFKEDFKYFFNMLKQRHDNQFTKILHYVNSPLHDNRPNIRNISFADALELSNQWHKEQEEKSEGVIEDEEGTVIMTFDDGYYWIDTESTSCKAEAKAMGHCGNTNKGTTILSLRDRDKRPHVTIAFDENNNIFTQIKGKGNTKPVEKYHPYIVDLIIDKQIDGFKSEYQRTTDFSSDDLTSELYDKLEENNPNYIENSKGLTEKELRQKYKEDLERDVVYSAVINSKLFFQYVDDSKLFDSLYREESSRTSLDTMLNYMDENEIKEWIVKNIDEVKLRDYLNSYIMLTLNDETSDKEDIKEFKKLLKKNNELDIEDLMEKEGYTTSDDYIRLISDMNLDRKIVKYYFENKYNRDVETYYRELYGNPDNSDLDRNFVNMVINYNAFDEEAFIDNLVRSADLEWLNDTFN